MNPHAMLARHLRHALLLCLLLVASTASAADSPAATRVDTMVVTGRHGTSARQSVPVSQGIDLTRLLRDTPFVMIRRGASASSDLYADGLKRGDITVTVDGERFTTACPNRMDTRPGQVDLLTVERVELVRSGAELQTGLGGKVAFRRRPPGQPLQVYGSLAGAYGHRDDQDLSLAVEGRRLRLSGRYRRAEAWKDADGGTFEDFYGYAETPASEVSWIQGVGAWDWGDAAAAFESSRDVLFPYLRMDERTNEHYQGSVSWRGHRLYGNYSDHVMDNGLRTSRGMTDMVTDATNAMAGMVGDAYEVYVRNWDADNRIIPVANPAMRTQSRMLPDVWQIYGVLQRSVDLAPGLALAGRLGLASSSVGDESQADRYAALYPDEDLEHWSVPFGATLSWDRPLSAGLDLGLAGEVASDPAGVEQRYINVDKPGANPSWLGNPGLNDPIRATVRAVLAHRIVRVELFGSRVWDYPYLIRTEAGGAPFETYAGVDALLAGVNAGLDWTHLAAGLVWNWGEKTADHGALAEIQPLTVGVTGRTSRDDPVRLWLHGEIAAEQGRVDASLGETATAGWNRWDLGVDLEADHWIGSVVVANLFNELYAQHLSYLRNPFAAGVTVREPGRSLQVTVAFRY